ncbi:MAG: hypothetical protein Q9195_009398, partial [Heterodermia aff. obscurata]
TPTQHAVFPPPPNLHLPRPTPLSSITTHPYESPSTLREALISAFYLSNRQQTLELLERFGKNSWLVHNRVLEDELRAVEQELVRCREETQGVNRGRKALQTGRKGEVEGLEAEWRRGVGRVVDVGVGLGEVERERVGVLREGVREGGRKGGRGE